MATEKSSKSSFTPLMMVIFGAIFLIASIALKAGPQFASQRIQSGLAIVCIIAAICLLFDKRSNYVAKSSATRDILIGFSVLIPVGVTGLLYNSFIPQLLGPDESFEGLYSFLLWVAFAIPSIHLWGQLLRFAGIISADEAQSIRTWRSIKQKQD